jgi:sialic acid synthase SpsE
MDPEKVPGAAVAKGAKLVEKHFTISRESQGIDHKMSIEPEELKRMVTTIKETEARMKRGEAIEIDPILLGTGEIALADDQKDLMKFTRRRVFVKTNIITGEEITADKLTILRPGNRHVETGLPAKDIDTVIGKKAVKDLAEGHMIGIMDFE